MEERIASLLETAGPLTGADIRGALGNDPFAQYKACMLSPLLGVRRVGRRYLRLDAKIDGYARLSPSILREFLTYTVVGLAGDRSALDRRTAELEAHVRDVSQQKLDLANRVAADIVASATGGSAEAARQLCIVLAGDIVYEMAHDVPRPERSTGTLVQGSDLDLVLLVGDEAPDELVARLDRATYENKHRYLRNPVFREEIDYVVKRFSRLREQAQFGDFKAMVACKIFEEAVLLVGSEELCAAGKDLLRERGVTDRLLALEQAALRSREQTEERLLTTQERDLHGATLLLFQTDLESDEFE